MLTLYHAPRSRSSRILTLIDELGVADRIEVRTVEIPRQDGSGGRDPANPHPEGKVPFLVHDGVGVRETGAIMLHLTDLFPEAGLGPLVGDPRRGAYLSWLFYYAAVVEPVMVLRTFLRLENPVIDATFRGPEEVTATLAAALEKGPWLLGDRYSAADLLLHSPYAWYPPATPDVPAIRDWVARCMDRPAARRTAAAEAAAAKLAHG